MEKTDLDSRLRGNDGIDLIRERQWRGLLLHSEDHRDRYFEGRAWGHRRIVRGLSAPLAGKRTGRCVWCGDATTGRRWRWHEDCVAAYLAAQGQQRYPGGRPLIALEGGCAECGGPATEVDHKEALALVWHYGDWDLVLAAHTLDNLQALCGDCHKAKTARDLAAITAIKAGRVAQPWRGKQLELSEEG